MSYRCYRVMIDHIPNDATIPLIQRALANMGIVGGLVRVVREGEQLVRIAVPRLLRADRGDAEAREWEEQVKRVIERCGARCEMTEVQKNAYPGGN